MVLESSISVVEPFFSEQLLSKPAEYARVAGIGPPARDVFLRRRYAPVTQISCTEMELRSADGILTIPPAYFAQYHYDDLRRTAEETGLSEEDLVDMETGERVGSVELNKMYLLSFHGRRLV